MMRISQAASSSQRTRCATAFRAEGNGEYQAPDETGANAECHIRLHHSQHSADSILACTPNLASPRPEASKSSGDQYSNTTASACDAASTLEPHPRPPALIQRQFFLEFRAMRSDSIPQNSVWKTAAAYQSH